MSSRTRVTTWPGDRECDAQDNDGIDCGWQGEVDVDFDPEDHTEWWECPACGQGHLDDMEGPDDDAAYDWREERSWDLT